jgi:dipeptidyl aminopeptidase/acylaminoacyl peptidase
VATGDATISASTGGVSGSASLAVQIPTTGTLRLSTTTVGRNLDPDGYSLVIDGDEFGPIGLDQTVTREELPPGTILVSLSGLADNCHSFDSYPVEATVVAGTVQDAILGVECLGVPADISLVFVEARPSDTTVNLVGLPEAGGDPVQLTFHPSLDRAPDWSPDGSRIAFSRDGVIQVMSADGTELRAFHEGTNPDWSPDGTRIAFERIERVFVFEPDGDQTALYGGEGSAPAWSPDGSMIAVDVLVTQRESDIFLLPSSGSEPVNLTNDPVRVDREAAWSPDGSQIVYRHLDRRENTGYDLWIMESDGSNPEELYAPAGAQVLPTWLPDDRIVFTSDPGVLVLELASGLVSPLALDGDGKIYSDGTWRSVP